ncbi:hemagglutinin [Gardnerella sp. 2492-Sm]|uniref:hemagglutinin n=1 Tax=unclassified Gardnerella TaxID=2628112 RepID=UPI003CFDBA6B
MAHRRNKYNFIRRNRSSARKSNILNKKNNLLTKIYSSKIFRNTLIIVVTIAILTPVVNWIRWEQNIISTKNRQEQLLLHFEFNPGNIISDSQFFNDNAMSLDDVREFVRKKGANCKGKNCLRKAYFNTRTIPADSLCSKYQGVSNEYSADIIYKSAKACHISQKVLLTMLQKEQHLLTDTNPKEFQYKSAMGLSCPDDANCDPKFAGFFNQVLGAARRYRYYLLHSDKYNYHPNTLNSIQYSPDKSCGHSNVYIENTATALLYIYTPYQPNLAALEAGFGEGDSCSTYGNRNFSLIYSIWFGNPRK